MFDTSTQPDPADTAITGSATTHSTTIGSTTDGGIGASVDASSPQPVTNPEAAGRSACDLEAAIIEAGRVLHASRHRLLRALAAFDDHGAWALTGAHSCANWAAGTLGVSIGTAREWLRVGHALAKLPLLDAAMADGRLSYCAVRTLTRVAVDHPEHEQELVALAVEALPGELGRDLARWTQAHDSDDQRDNRERDQTYMSWRIEPDAMATITIRVPVLELGRIQAAVDARVMQSTKTDPDDPRPSLGRQRARALIELLTGTNPANGKGIRVNTEVILHVRADGCSMHDGTPIADNTVAELLDTAFIRMLITDAENRPVNASIRRRHPTTRQKRVIDEQHPRCTDCGNKELLEYDHKTPYRITLRTHTDEMTRRCPACHDRKTKAERDLRHP